MPASPAPPAWRWRPRARTATALSALTPPAQFLIMHAAAALAIAAVATRAAHPGGFLLAALDPAGRRLAVQRRHRRAHALGHRLFPMAAPIGGSTMIVGWLVLAAAGIWELLAHRG